MNRDVKKACVLNAKSIPRSQVCKRKRHVSAQRAEQEDLRYWPCTILGSGTYGQVFQCWDAIERKHVAVKQFIAQEQEDLPQSSLREISILRRCSHENIIPVQDLLFEPRQLAYFGKKFIGGFAMPICHGGDLGHWLRTKHNRGIMVHNNTRISLAKQLLEAVCYLHQRSIVHRDIKPQNCMLNAEGTHLYLCDLGLGRQCTIPLAPSYTGTVCTLWYRPPEILLGSRAYGFGVDIWSVGTTIAELYTVSPLFKSPYDLGQLFAIFMKLGTPTESSWPGVSDFPDYCAAGFPKFKRKNLADFLPNANSDAVDLIEKMLIYIPVQRISAKKALRHAYFGQICSLVDHSTKLDQKTSDLIDLDDDNCMQVDLDCGSKEKAREKFPQRKACPAKILWAYINK